MCKISASFFGVVSGPMLSGESVEQAKTRLIKELETEDVYLYETIKTPDPRAIAQAILYAREIGDVYKACESFCLPTGLWYLIQLAYSQWPKDALEWAEKIMEGKAHEYSDPNPTRNTTCGLPTEIVQERPCPGEDEFD